jgi:hypothetical protein
MPLQHYPSRGFNVYGIHRKLVSGLSHRPQLFGNRMRISYSSGTSRKRRRIHIESCIQRYLPARNGKGGCSRKPVHISSPFVYFFVGTTLMFVGIMNCLIKYREDPRIQRSRLMGSVSRQFRSHAMPVASSSRLCAILGDISHNEWRLVV